MPTYVYECPTCQERFERWQSFKEQPLQECPQGHQGVRRVITPPPVIFKGSGWYITDSRSNTNSNGKVAKSTSSDASESTTESTAESKAETSSESKTESKSETATSSSSTSTEKPPAKAAD
jgi:putative FmdB family regulatory protein